MKKVFFSVLLALAVVSVGSLGMTAYAGGEHGGSEHGGSEHGGGKMEGSHGHGHHGGKAATLLEAAEALAETNPRLACELKSIAKDL